MMITIDAHTIVAGVMLLIGFCLGNIFQIVIRKW